MYINVCMYLHILYTYMYAYTYTCVYTYIYMYTCIMIYIYTHICTPMYAYICIYEYLFVHTCMRKYIYTYTSYLYTNLFWLQYRHFIYIYLYMYVHMCIYEYPWVHVYICLRISSHHIYKHMDSVCRFECTLFESSWISPYVNSFAVACCSALQCGCSVLKCAAKAQNPHDFSAESFCVCS